MDYRKIRRQEKNNFNTKLVVGAVIVAAAMAAAAAVTVYRHGSTAGSSTPDNAAAVPQLTEAATAEAVQTVQPTAAATATAAATEAPQTAEAASARGTAQDIPDDIKTIMDGKSMHENDDISYSDLSYLTMPYIDFNGERQVGHMVVNKALAEEVLDIFAELYDIGYPIERMEIVDMYDADDYTSIDNNNTSAFNYRVSTDGTGRLSKHALGRAIDINPQINPYVDSSGEGSHPNAEEYWTRDPENWTSTTAKKAYIGPGTDIYRIFVDEHGWEWGGSWSSYRDYQHFQKF